tara:strand:+ start:11 stop:298 length:288 start_codon:yes stop_codon:yes gene_type:complete
MNVKLIRVVTGEEIVAEVVSETDDTITVKNGLVVLPTGQSIGFAPWATVISKEEPEITMNLKHVIYVAEVQDSVSQKYKEMFGNIITPQEKKLIL